MAEEGEVNVEQSGQAADGADKKLEEAQEKIATLEAKVEDLVKENKELREFHRLMGLPAADFVRQLMKLHGDLHSFHNLDPMRTYRLMRDAAENGSLEDVKWLVEKRQLPLARDMKQFSEESKEWRRTMGLLSGAARANRLDLLKWLVDEKGVSLKGFKQSWFPLHFGEVVGQLTPGQFLMAAAAAGGHYEAQDLLEFCRERGVALSETAANHAAR